MRALVILLAVGLVPLFVAWQKHHYDTDLRPELAAEIDRALNAPEFAGVKAELNGLDVSLSGTIADFVLRRRVEARIDALPGVWVRPVDNHIRVVAVLSFRREAGVDRIDGQLHSEDLRSLQTTIARRSVPEAAQIRVRGDPLVKALEPRLRRLLLAATNDFMTLPGPRSLIVHNDQAFLQGTITLQRLARLWEQAGPGDDLERLLYQAPLYASLYHLPDYRPDYRPETGPDAGALTQVRSRLAAAQVSFETDSADLGPQEREQLKPLADAIRSAGDRARFVIGGHVKISRAKDIQAGIELGRRRAEAVLGALVGLGLIAERFEVVDFGPTDLSGDPDEAVADGVEVLLK